MTDILTLPLKIHSEAAVSRLGEETVILHLESGVYFGLDPLGTRIWECIAKGQTGQEICSVLSEEFEETKAVIEQDVRAFLSELQARDLLVG